MNKVWYVMELEGPYGWRQAKLTTGPYYDEFNWFRDGSYKTKEDAESAVSAVIDEFDFGPFFIMEAYE